MHSHDNSDAQPASPGNPATTAPAGPNAMGDDEPHARRASIAPAAEDPAPSVGDVETAGILPPVKPLLRGWLHLGTAPLALATGIVLTILTPSPYRWTSVVFTMSSVVLFGMSALYHRGNWQPRVHALLRRFDHANIFLLIAGTYTPLSWVLLGNPTRYIVLGIVWIGAILGIVMKVSWMGAPRWLYVPLYIALGWVAIWFLPEFARRGSGAIVALIIAGGIAYTLGAVAYALKRPNPAPRWFGFHEIFHTGTVIGWVCHAVAVFIVMLTVA